jgi:hypothetical protein
MPNIGTNLSPSSFCCSLALSLMLSLSACVVTTTQYFSRVKETTDSTYGYTIENPIMIKNGDLFSSNGAANYFLTRLSTLKGNYLINLRRETIRNPAYTPPDLSSRMPRTKGNGPLLNVYYLVPNNEADTIRLYINPYLKGQVKVPVGLKFSNY